MEVFSVLHTTNYLRTRLMDWPIGKTRLAFLAILLAAFCGVSIAHADEVVIEEGYSSSNVAIGDYSCSPCLAKLASAAFEIRNSSDHNTVELTAGELWQFFNNQGHDSVSAVTLFVDVDQLSTKDQLNLSKLNIQIRSPDGNLVTDANLGTNRLVVPGSETSSTKPEAELRFDLGYDFMKLFSPDSTELVRVSIDSPIGASMSPSFHLVADENVLGRTNLGSMFLFVLFWGAVFLVLLRWMKPVRQELKATVSPKRIISPVRRTA